MCSTPIIPGRRAFSCDPHTPLRKIRASVEPNIVNPDTREAPFPGGINGDGDIFAQAGGAGGGSGGGVGSVGPSTFKPSCKWTPGTPENVVSLGIEVPESAPDSPVENPAGELLWIRKCPGGPAELVWVAPLDPTDLIPDALARARARLPLPTPNMNPAPEVGSVVNLGVWFAIEDPGITVARASLGSVWAEVRGTFSKVVVDPGDGSAPVECDGFGVPYVEGSEDPGEGPCGHTYLQRTPADDPYRLRYAITYDISWSTSDGRSGSLGTFDRYVVLDYDIDEIQTVGTD